MLALALTLVLDSNSGRLICRGDGSHGAPAERQGLAGGGRARPMIDRGNEGVCKDI